MNRHVSLRRVPFPRNPESVPLGRNVSLRSAGRITASRAGKIPAAGRLVSRQPINPVSDRRRAENRERRAMADRLWPDRREGTVMCGCGRPECHRYADDGHELLSRARGGSITDEVNVRPLARECHAEVTLGPAWAYAAGLIKHDGLCCQGRRVCAQYAEGDEAA